MLVSSPGEREREATIFWKRLDLALIELSHVKISTVDLPKPIIVIDNENTFQAIRWITTKTAVFYLVLGVVEKMYQGFSAITFGPRKA